MNTSIRGDNPHNILYSEGKLVKSSGLRQLSGETGKQSEGGVTEGGVEERENKMLVCGFKLILQMWRRF